MKKGLFFLRVVACSGITAGVIFFFCLTALSGLVRSAAFAAETALEDEEYTLDVGDVIEVTVWRNPELSKTLTIRPDGRISMPLVGEVKAAGTTPGQLSALITASLAQTYIKDPKVTVILDEVGSKQVLVLGEVRSPGIYTMSRHLTALQAIGLAGGQNKYAHLESTIVVRNPQADTPNVYMIDVQKVLKQGGADNFTIQPGDIVFVPKSFLGKVDDLFSFFARNIAPIANSYIWYQDVEND